MKGCQLRIIIPNFAAPDSFVDNVATTLREMGHHVLTLPAVPNRWLNSPVRRIGRQVLSAVVPRQAVPEERWLRKATRRFRPHVVLALTQSLSDDTLATLKRLGVGARVAWWGDTPANMRGMGLLRDGWDYIFLKDRDAVAKFRRVGLNAELLHEAMNPSWHRPIADQAHDRLAVAGSFYGYRQILVLRLMHHAVAVDLYGGRLPRWVAPEIAERHTGRFIVREEKSKVFGAALGCLNSTALSEGNSLNCRAFEIAGAGGLQFLEYRPAVEECFDPGRELLAFHTFEQLLELIQWATRDAAGARAVRRAGAARALAEHTYGHRLTRILECLR
jgi:spore maturation protein CgeB